MAQAQKKNPSLKLSIVIPAYNEEKTIAKILDKVMKLEVAKEVIVVNDASKDRTNQILAACKKDPFLKIITHRENQGKGAAVRTGVKKARGEYVIIQDADLEYEPKEILKLLAFAEKTGAQVVYGSRFQGKIKRMTLPSRLGNQFLTFLTNLLYGTSLTDMETCYKLFAREVIQKTNWEADEFDFEPEITARVLKKGIKIKEIPISYQARKKSEGKKISWQDGVRAAGLLLKYKLFA